MSHEVEKKFTFTWKIDNYSFCNENHKEYLTSPQFTAESLGLGQWYLEFCPRGNSSEEYTPCNVCICDSKLIDDFTILDCILELISPNGEILSSKKFEKDSLLEATDSSDGYFEWENIVKIDSLITEMKNWTEDTLTIRCRIIAKPQTRQPAIECEARTKIGVDRCSFLWRVSYPDTPQWPQSKNFLLSDKIAFEVTLTVRDDDVMIHITIEGENSAYVTCRMSLVDVRGNEQYSQSASYLFHEDTGDNWQFPTFFTQTILDDEEDTLLDKDTFALICNFSVTNEINSNEIKYHTLPALNTSSMVDAVSSLQSDLCNMFTNKKYADVKLKVGNQTFPAHKSLLVVRSPVFSAMFDQDMLENQTGVVEISDTDVKTMNSFLEFIYTGTVEVMDYENASKLLTVAEKYQVLSLKEECASFLMSALSEENVCEAFVLGDMVGHEILKASSLDYIKSHARNILRSPQWPEWMEKNAKLATEIFCMLSTNIISGK